MSSSVYVVYLDRYHLGDPLFLKDLAKKMAGAQTPECIFIHGSGEKAERTLEAEGLFVEREHGVLQVQDESQRQLVERSAREMNKEVVNYLTDEQVPAVGIQGVDRRLFVVGEDEEVTTGSIGWVEDLVRMRVTLVISSLVRKEDGTVQEAPPTASIRALASHLSEQKWDVTVVCFAKSRQALHESDKEETGTLDVSVLDQSHFSEPQLLKEINSAAGSVMLSSLEDFFQDPVQGKRLHTTHGQTSAR